MPDTRQADTGVIDDEPDFLGFEEDPSAEGESPKDKGQPAGGDKTKDKNEGLTADERSELERLRKRVPELENESSYWHNRANGRGQDVDEETDDEPDPEDPAQPDIDDEDPTQLIEDLTKSGIKALTKRGFLTPGQVKQMIREEATRISRQGIASAAQQLASDAQMMREYPDLNDEKSELYKRTATILKDLVKRDEKLATNPGALWAAARAAKAELATEEAGRRGRDRAGDGDEDGDRQGRRPTREERIRAQAGERGGGRGFDEEDDDFIAPETRRVMKMMGVSEESFRKSRKDLGITGRKR